MANSDVTIGMNIRRARMMKNWSQTQLSSKTGISTTTLSAYETGKSKPGLDSLAYIASALEVTIDELYYGNQSEKPVTTAHNKGEAIINCVYYLWQRKILGRVLTPQKNKEYIKEVQVAEYTDIIYRFIAFLDEYNAKVDTYSDPELFLRQMKESASEEINKLDGKRQSYVNTPVPKFEEPRN